MIYDYKKISDMIFMININRSLPQIIRINNKINTIIIFFVTLIFNVFIFFMIITNLKVIKQGLLSFILKARILIIDLLFFTLIIIFKLI